jgi:hypothetical protein
MDLSKGDMRVRGGQAGTEIRPIARTLRVVAASAAELPMRVGGGMQTPAVALTPKSNGRPVAVSMPEAPIRVGGAAQVPATTGIVQEVPMSAFPSTIFKPGKPFISP